MFFTRSLAKGSESFVSEYFCSRLSRSVRVVSRATCTTQVQRWLGPITWKFTQQFGLNVWNLARKVTDQTRRHDVKHAHRPTCGACPRKAARARFVHVDTAADNIVRCEFFSNSCPKRLLVEISAAYIDICKPCSAVPLSRCLSVSPPSFWYYI